MSFDLVPLSTPAAPLAGLMIGRHTDSLYTANMSKWDDLIVEDPQKWLMANLAKMPTMPPTKPIVPDEVVVLCVPTPGLGAFVFDWMDGTRFVYCRYDPKSMLAWLKSQSTVRDRAWALATLAKVMKGGDLEWSVSSADDTVFSHIHLGDPATYKEVAPWLMLEPNGLLLDLQDHMTGGAPTVTTRVKNKSGAVWGAPVAAKLSRSLINPIGNSVFYIESTAPRKLPDGTTVVVKGCHAGTNNGGTASVGGIKMW